MIFSSTLKNAAQNSEKPTRLFRRIDLWTSVVTTLLVFFCYFWTLAPNLTLEDSGELAVGSFYAGVPHPPGYPVWTIYTWLFTVLVPISNIAWRVALSSAVAAAFSCGLLSLMTSRGSSMLLEGIAGLKTIDHRLENLMCMVAGFVAGMLLGFNGFMWSQAVIVEVYTLSVLSLMVVLVCLLRWVYEPQKLRYLYWAFFLFGLCFTNHQTLIVSAMGIQVLIMMVRPALGRDVFLASGLIYIVGLMLKAKGYMTSLDNNLPLFIIYNVVGVGCVGAFGWLWSRTRRIGTDWKPVLIIGALWILGAMFYFYMPLASMTNPPMNWGYPRTVEGFIHALTRGQYEQTNPTTSIWRFINQLRMYYEATQKEFNAYLLFVGLLPFAWFPDMQKRERSWLAGLGSMYLCLAVLLLILLNPNTDRQSRELNRVFFTASHVMVALGIGYGFTLIAGIMSTYYQRVRHLLLWGGAVAVAFSVYDLKVTFEESNFLVRRLAAFLGFILPTLFTLMVLKARIRPPVVSFLLLAALVPGQSILSHWSDNEQRGHLFGYWFGHDMFSPPSFQNEQGEVLYPEMARDAILFGGTDPGRFNPTYMIFGDSFTPPEHKRDPEFDRRDVYLITQNALADGTYLNYIRAHYNRSTQVDPPFFQELFRSKQERMDNKHTNIVARSLQPLDRFFTGLGDQIEKQRRAGSSFFAEFDFIDLAALAAVLRPENQGTPLTRYLSQQFSPSALEKLVGNRDDPGLGTVVAAEFNRLLEAGPLYRKDRFEGVDLSSRTRRLIAENPRGHTRIRLNRLLLEEAFPGFIARSPGGVYPDLEIYTPSVEDSQRTFEEYVNDAQRRHQLNQLKPGEIVNVIEDKVQVSGQVAVMAINALLTQIIFERNPDHEFYVEESFPLEWMYPHLSPFGIIMKLNREPLVELSEDLMARDHDFWRQYSQRLIGDWITCDTPIEVIVDFVKRVYRRRDFTGFRGDAKFIRDRNAQKAFSKLRSSIAGIYAWRLSAECPEEYQPKSTEAQQRLLKEADFAFRQAFAFCPYSPEAVSRYSNLLVNIGRVQDALLISETCFLFDQENTYLLALIRRLQGLQHRSTNTLAAINQIAALQKQLETDPTNVQTAFDLVNSLLAVNNSNAAIKVLDDLLVHPQADATVLLSIAQAYKQLGQAQRLEKAFYHIVTLIPDNPEAWYDLAAIQVLSGKTNEAIQSLARAIKLSDARLESQSDARNLLREAEKDARFAGILRLPEFQEALKVVAGAENMPGLSKRRAGLQCSPHSQKNQGCQKSFNRRPGRKAKAPGDRRSMRPVLRLDLPRPSPPGHVRGAKTRSHKRSGPRPAQEEASPAKNWVETEIRAT